MSKKQTQKKKITVKVTPGESVLVADIEVMRHIMDTYSEMIKVSKEQSDIKYYSNIVETILDWTTRTYYSGQVDDEEEW